MAKKLCVCGKKKYATFAAVVGAALGTSRLFGKPKRPYRCDKTRSWHLTTWSAKQCQQQHRSVP